MLTGSPSRSWPDSALLDEAVGHHAAQIRDLDHAIADPATVAELLLLLPPVGDVDDQTIAWSRTNHATFGVGEHRDAILVVPHFALQRREFGLAGPVRGLDASAEVVDVEFGQFQVQPGLLQLDRGKQFGRTGGGQAGLAQAGLRLGQGEFVVGGTDLVIHAALLGLLHRPLEVVAPFSELLPDLRRGRIPRLAAPSGRILPPAPSSPACTARCPEPVAVQPRRSPRPGGSR
jgi:hypothetical protein